MLTFHIKYKTGATFTYVHEIKNSHMLQYFINQFRQDPLVDRVLVGLE